jgi:hypothetical protein
VLRPDEGASESAGGQVMRAVQEFLAYVIFAACIYVVLVVGGAS